MITVLKNSKESFERFMSRFDNKVQRSRIVRVLRERRYRKKDLNKVQQRARAIKREENRARRRRMSFY